VVGFRPIRLAPGEGIAGTHWVSGWLAGTQICSERSS